MGNSNQTTNKNVNRGDTSKVAHSSNHHSLNSQIPGSSGFVITEDLIEEYDDHVGGSSSNYSKNSHVKPFFLIVNYKKLLIIIFK
jgi:hypothetical protein